MKKLCFIAALLSGINLFAQTDTANKWLRAFPITDYMVDLNDSTKVVQLEMPEDGKLKENQLGLLWGVYHTSKEDAVQKGYGKCHLIKGVYYYFSIRNNKSGHPLKKGDLLYTFMDRTNIYFGLAPQMASHFILLKNVYETPLYDRYTIFLNWSEDDERRLIDSVKSDIQFTGQYFIQNNPSMDKLISQGEYKGRKTLYIMAECQAEDIKKFFNYILARPGLYAGKEWKVSEIFATWLSEGAPTILSN